MTARDAALLRLDALALPGWPRASIKRAGPARETLDPRDADLARELYAGVVRRLFLLRHFLSVVSGKSAKQIDPAVQKIACVALYQLRFLDRVPAAAAVDGAVNQAHKFRLGRAAGFLNAVLRKAANAKLEEFEPRREDDETAWATVTQSHPRPLFDKLVALLGEERALDQCEHHNVAPPTLARLIPPHDASALTIAHEPHEQSGVVVLPGARRGDLARLSADGVLQPQDATSAAIAPYLDVRPGLRVLDRCCGVGTKTAQLVEASGQVVAVDRDGRRLETLARVAQARGWGERVALVQGEGAPLGPFDRVLVDAPCSNSGVLARRPEARYRQTAKALASAVEVQRALLRDTADAVAPGGRLVYATCSVWDEENLGVLDAFCAEREDFEPIEERAWHGVPGAPASAYRDGGYCAVLVRRA